MSSDFFERGPKCVFQADTSLVAADPHRPLNNRRFRYKSFATAKRHSITSSAVASSDDGTVSPSAFKTRQLIVRDWEATITMQTDFWSIKWISREEGLVSQKSAAALHSNPSR